MVESTNFFQIPRCVYCGDVADTKDHVVPLSYYYSGDRGKGLHLTNDFGEDNLVDCCRECNTIANNKVFDDIYAKKNYIQEQLIKRYKKVINFPFWSDDELKEMGPIMRKEIKMQQLARVWAINRVNYPKDVYPRVLLNLDILRFIEKEL